MILLDKGYFDYDSVAVENKAPQINWEDTIKSDEEVQGILSAFGLGGHKKKPETIDEIQQHIIKQESYGS